MAMDAARERVAPAKAGTTTSPAQPSLKIALHRVQPKLAVSAPDDPYEHEADRVAAAVMRMPAPAVQRKCAACSAGGATCPHCEEEEARVQRKVEGVRHAGEVSADFASRLRGGAPLDRASRAFFEPRFGHSFGNVRVHTGPEADAAARSIHARAFTLGRNVAFAVGEYDPQSERGRSLLAHELVHVVQQAGTPRGVFRQPAAVPAPLTRAQFDDTLKRRFAVADIRTGTREEQANSLNLPPEDLPNWRPWAPDDPSTTYASILEGFENFAASFGGTPNVREIVFFRTRYRIERSASGRVVVEDETAGAHFSHGKLVLFQLAEDRWKALPIARSNTTGMYPPVSGLGVQGPGSSPGAPTPQPTTEENARRVVIHELGHGLEEAATGPIHNALDPMMLSAYMFEAGWTEGTPPQLYDVGVPEVRNALRFGVAPPEQYRIEQDRWNSPNWVEQPVSGYMVGEGPKEDFAEAVMVYVENPSLLQSRSPRRYKFLDHRKNVWQSRLLQPRPTTPGQKSSDIPIGIYLIVEDPDNAPLIYHRLTPYQGLRDRGEIVEVWHDSGGYYYLYRGRRIPLPERP